MLREKFCEGGKGPSPRRFPSVVAYAATCDGASHIASAADIVLGMSAYCVNQRGDVPITRKLLRSMWPLVWHPEGCTVWGDGIMFVPYWLKSSRWQGEYFALQSHLENLLSG